MNETLKGALPNRSYKCIHKMHQKIIQVQCIICMQWIICFWLFDYNSDARSRSWLNSNPQWRIMLILEWHLVYQAMRELFSLKQEVSYDRSKIMISKKNMNISIQLKFNSSRNGVSILDYLWNINDILTTWKSAKYAWPTWSKVIFALTHVRFKALQSYLKSKEMY